MFPFLPQTPPLLSQQQPSCFVVVVVVVVDPSYVFLSFASILLLPKIELPFLFLSLHSSSFS